MAATQKRQFDESLISYFDEKVMAHADTTFRFAYAMTLNFDTAFKCMKDAFKITADHLEEVRRAPEGSELYLLIRECWKSCQKATEQKPRGNPTPVVDFFAKLDRLDRAALVVTDIVGLDPQDGAKALGFQEKEFREHLARGRRALLTSTLPV